MGSVGLRRSQTSFSAMRGPNLGPGEISKGRVHSSPLSYQHLIASGHRILKRKYIDNFLILKNFQIMKFVYSVYKSLNIT